MATSNGKKLRMQGIPGHVHESRIATEQIARQFKGNDLKFDQARIIEIDDARRDKSSNPTKPTILLTFSNSEDISTIMQKAKENLQGNSGVYVQYDYTDRVRRHRKILGERMLIEHQQGNYSSVRHDKLIINDGIYKYSDNAQSIEYIGRRQSYGSRQPTQLTRTSITQSWTTNLNSHSAIRMKPMLTECCRTSRTVITAHKI
ncbi:hypothetical protein DPMN_105798 [Dreissena polymorpha]|uniref:Uncharacterized protein n=1 Tax=Dreissena polymorpha TaxID=45954 RepID=A0A9D4K3U3_DREPO|nr:hypothetical protein DPMN_105798 [Dreissena polymorpha]